MLKVKDREMKDYRKIIIQRIDFFNQCRKEAIEKKSRYESGNHGCRMLVLHDILIATGESYLTEDERHELVMNKPLGF